MKLESAAKVSWDELKNQAKEEKAICARFFKEMADRFEEEMLKEKSAYNVESVGEKQIINLEKSNKEEEKDRQILVLDADHDRNWWRHLNL